MSSVNSEVSIPNEIWYTSSDGKVVKPYSTSVFGANIVSNTYENGKGVIKFDGPVTSIGERAFYNCDSLIEITILDRVTSIGFEAFYSCDYLENVAIGNSVTSIGGSAFDLCGRLTEITIPNSVTSIGDYAFYRCSRLKDIICEPTTPPTSGRSIFRDNVSNRKIYVPINSVEAYKSATGWKDFASYIIGYSF